MLYENYRLLWENQTMPCEFKSLKGNFFIIHNFITRKSCKTINLIGLGRSEYVYILWWVIASLNLENHNFSASRSQFHPFLWENQYLCFNTFSLFSKHPLHHSFLSQWNLRLFSMTFSRGSLTLMMLIYFSLSFSKKYHLKKSIRLFLMCYGSFATHLLSHCNSLLYFINTLRSIHEIKCKKMKKNSHKKCWFTSHIFYSPTQWFLSDFSVLNLSCTNHHLYDINFIGLLFSISISKKKSLIVIFFIISLTEM